MPNAWQENVRLTPRTQIASAVAEPANTTQAATANAIRRGAFPDSPDQSQGFL